MEAIEYTFEGRTKIQQIDKIPRWINRESDSLVNNIEYKYITVIYKKLDNSLLLEI